MFVVFCAMGWAQFAEFATTDDGQHLYFTSRLKLSAASAASLPENRIFHFGPNGLELFRERGALMPGGLSAFSGSDGMATPQVSGDGSLIGLTARNICPNGDSCTPVQAEGLLAGARSTDLGPGDLHLSKNGRWALLVAQATLGEAPAAKLIDLQTSQTTSILALVSDGWVIASNGAVLIGQTTDVGTVPGIWKQGQFAPLSFTGRFRPIAISDDAGTLLYIAGFGESLIARNLQSGGETILATSDPPILRPNLLGLSNDGRLALYNVWNGQTSGPAYVANTTTGVSLQLLLDLDDGELANGGTLSGSGNTAYLATSAGRIVRFPLTDGVPAGIETVVSKTPYVSSTFGFSPGSMVRTQGALPRSVDELSGGILLNGNPIPVLYASETEIRVQIPWEVKPGQASLTLNLPSTSSFHQNDLFTLRPFAPQFELAESGQHTILGLKLVKGDFSALQTTQPGPGDIVHAYLTGLSTVAGQVQTGIPAPIDTVFPITGQLTCQFLPQQNFAETLFAGLAPAMIGIYQVSFRMPADAGQAPITGLRCSFGNAFGSGTFGIFSVIGTAVSP